MSSVLTTNSSLFFANSLINGNGKPSAYTLFDLASIVENIVLFNQIHTLPSRNIESNQLFNSLRHNKIVSELPVNERVLEIASELRQEIGGHEETEDLTSVMSEMLPIDKRVIRKAIAKRFHYANSSWRTPTAYAPRDWFLDYVNSENTGNWDWEFYPKKVFNSPFTKGYSKGNLSIAQEIIAGVLVRGDLYQRIAMEFGYNYSPDSIRVPLTRYRLNQVEIFFAFARKAIEKLEEKEVKKGKAIDEALGIHKFNICTPALLSVVLQKSKKPEDIIDEALKLRKEKKSVKFREWGKKVDVAVKIGDRETASNALKDMNKAFDDENRSKKEEICANIVSNISINAATLAPSIKLGALIKPIFSFYYHLRRPHIIFLNNLRNRISHIKSIDSEITRVFGVGLSEDDLILFKKIKSK